MVIVDMIPYLYFFVVHVLSGLCIPHDLRKHFFFYKMKLLLIIFKLYNYCRERMEKNHKEMWIKNRSRYGVKGTKFYEGIHWPSVYTVDY